MNGRTNWRIDEESRVFLGNSKSVRSIQQGGHYGRRMIGQSAELCAVPSSVAPHTEQRSRRPQMPMVEHRETLVEAYGIVNCHRNHGAESRHLPPCLVKPAFGGVGLCHTLTGVMRPSHSADVYSVAKSLLIPRSPPVLMPRSPPVLMPRSLGP
eukprot:SAG11_NODE_2678_length_3105_cov_2.120758_5_plen_154_part_00